MTCPVGTLSNWVSGNPRRLSPKKSAPHFHEVPIFVKLFRTTLWCAGFEVGLDDRDQALEAMNSSTKTTIARTNTKKCIVAKKGFG